MRPGEAALPAEARRHLGAGETLPWHGRPIARMILRPTVPYLVLALVGAFVLSMIFASPAKPPERDPWATFAIIGPLACLVILLSRWTAWYGAHHTPYVIGDARIIVVRGGRFGRTTAIPRIRGRRSALLPGWNGSGTISVSLGLFPGENDRHVERWLDLGVIADVARPLALLRE